MRLHHVIMKHGPWRTVAGRPCIADPEGVGGVWIAVFLKITRKYIVLPLWWNYRYIIHFNCSCEWDPQRGSFYWP